MRVLEFNKGDGHSQTFALAIVIAAESAAEIESNFREAKQALHAFRAKRGAACETILFSVVAPRHLHQLLAERLWEFYAGERDLREFFGSVAVRVHISEVSEGDATGSFQFNESRFEPINDMARRMNWAERNPHAATDHSQLDSRLPATADYSPEYGQFPGDNPNRVQAPISSAAIASVIFGVLSIPAVCTIVGAFLTSLVAIVCGHIAQLNIRQAKGGLRGRGMAFAGALLGYMCLAVAIVLAGAVARWYFQNQDEKPTPLPMPTPSVATRNTFPANTEEAIEFLNSSDESERRRGVSYLSMHPPETPDYAIIARLFELYEAEGDGGGVFMIANALTKCAGEEHVDTLDSLLDSENALVRQVAATRMGEIQTDECAALLIARLDDKSLRGTVNSSLRNMGPAAEPALLELLASPQQDLREQAIMILGQCGTENSIDVLQSISDDPDDPLHGRADFTMRMIRARLKQ